MKYCTKCGKKLADSARFCTECGLWIGKDRCAQCNRITITCSQVLKMLNRYSNR